MFVFLRGFTLAQVIPDWRGMNKVGEALSAQSKQAWRDRVASFLRKKSADNPPPKRVKLQDKFMANKYHMQAFDHALCSTFGFGLAKFLVDRPCVALELGEVRFYVDTKDSWGCQSACAHMF